MLLFNYSALQGVKSVRNSIWHTIPHTSSVQTLQMFGKIMAMSIVRCYNGCLSPWVSDSIPFARGQTNHLLDVSLKMSSWLIPLKLGFDFSKSLICFRGTTPVNNIGLGINKPDEVNAEDDEFEAYRKRMMLAYRFRPNPLVGVLVI